MINVMHRQAFMLALARMYQDKKVSSMKQLKYLVTFQCLPCETENTLYSTLSHASTFSLSCNIYERRKKKQERKKWTDTAFPSLCVLFDTTVCSFSLECVLFDTV